MADQLAALGIRWVVVLHDVDWRDYRELMSDPGLVPTLSGSDLDLFRVASWRGPIRLASGTEQSRHAVIAPLGIVAASGPAVWDAPSQTGWMRGWSTAGRTANGLVQLPAGRGLVWFWPSLLVAAGDIATLSLGAVLLFRSAGSRANLSHSQAL